MSFRKTKATKSNLLKLEKKKEFALRGSKFLEFKREQLINHIKESWESYQIGSKEFQTSFRKCLILLNKTYKEMGKRDLSLISNISKIQHNPRVDILYKKKFGLSMPIFEYQFDYTDRLPAYGFDNTSHYLDDLITNLKMMLISLLKTAEEEDKALNYVFNFKRINRRINALENIVIPRLFSDIKLIKEKLEEIDRENFVRLKKTKDLIEKKNRVFI